MHRGWGHMGSSLWQPQMCDGCLALCVYRTIERLSIRSQLFEVEREIKSMLQLVNCVRCFPCGQGEGVGGGGGFET